MEDKKPNTVVSKTEINIGDVKAGRTSPFPSNDLRPKVVIKPKDCSK